MKEKIMNGVIVFVAFCVAAYGIRCVVEKQRKREINQSKWDAYFLYQDSFIKNTDYYIMCSKDMRRTSSTDSFDYFYAIADSLNLRGTYYRLMCDSISPSPLNPPL
jgi:hypothetical protein